MLFLFFNDTATTEIYTYGHTLSLHDALPIYRARAPQGAPRAAGATAAVIERDVPLRALAVFAHPDDPEVSCGGTLARWTRGGSEVHLVIANRGDKGSSDPATDPDELAARRADEVTEAAAVLGLAGVEHLGYPDGEIDNDAVLRERLIEAIRRLRPDALIAPDPTAVFFGDSYVNHRDHRELGWAVQIGRAHV